MLLAAQESVSEKAQCYQSFNAQNGSCGHLLGEAEVDDCCLNPHYGHKGADGVCQSCRPASWTDWSLWGSCTRLCLEGVRQRRRFCYGHGTCSDTHKLGSLQTRPCNCCPEQGGWADWGQWQACSVSCGMGQKRRERTCSSPPPVCGSCSGQNVDHTSCDTGEVCPAPVPTPPPPPPSPGIFCTGTELCVGLPYCAVPGGWGPWSAYSECPVTCGLGQRVRTRQCDSPVPRPDGQYCPGESTSTLICNTDIHCPVNGEWSEWGEWSACKRGGKDIKCKTTSPGIQTRSRSCEHRAWNGTPCLGFIAENRPCYDIENCRLYGNWSEWGTWGLCQPNCGSTANKTRKRECVLNFSKYTNPVMTGSGPKIVHFVGKPMARCARIQEKEMSAPCLNVPPCT
ncbi:hypothetical protein SKAU_G00178530 [Synaphobranchus kaupii]|uniref:Properdin n=1 Tax=Synaphobranchus kaupii TaxID=118154 RepID=A0A9Q1FLR3_SYNKA|nr:hypothetical protein SKAU_G00178530 [Synaphobranchus kaupii]